MATTPEPRGGVLVIRAWLEDDSTLRARLISVTDVRAGHEEVSWAASAEEIHHAVGQWLDGILTASS